LSAGSGTADVLGHVLGQGREIGVARKLGPADAVAAAAPPIGVWGDAMTDETRDLRAPAEAPPPPPDAPQPPARQPYRRPDLRSGERLEETTLASCLTGPQFCGPYALEA